MSAGAPGRKLTLVDATLMVMGGIIGVGIFFNPHAIAERVPVPWLYLALWAFGGIVAVAAGFTFAEWGSALPSAGGWFVYLRAAFGRFAAFLFAWVVLFVQSTGAIASIAKFCAMRLHILFPGRIGAEGSTSATAASAILIGLVTVVALTGVKRAALVQNACMVTKLAVIAALMIGGLVYASSGAAPAPAESAALPAFSWSKLTLALLPLFYTLGGWQLLGYIAPEIRDPARTLPRAILWGVAGVVLVYLVVNASYLAVLGIDGLARDADFARTLSQRAFGPVGEKVLAAGMCVSAFGICAVNIITTPWLYVAMAREGLFFASIGHVEPRSGVPRRALVLQAAITCVYLFGTLGFLVDSVVFVEWVFHGLAALGLMLFLRREPARERPFRSPLYPLAPLLYLATAALVVGGTLYTAERQVKATGIAVLAAGALAYRPWRALVERTGA